MKKIQVLLLTLSCIAITHNSFSMIRRIVSLKSHAPQQNSHFSTQTFNNSKILITKESEENLKTISQDYQIISNLIGNKSKELKHYEKPSDLIYALFSQDKSTKHMSSRHVFPQKDINFLDKQFEKGSTGYGIDFAWNNIIFLMHTKLENSCDYFKDLELINSAARVSFYQLDNNVIPFSIEHWKQEDKDRIIEDIKHRRDILSRAKNLTE